MSRIELYDSTFPVRLYGFVKEVTVNGLMDEEEQEYILMIAKRLRKHQEQTCTDEQEKAYLERTKQFMK